MPMHISPGRIEKKESNILKIRNEQTKKAKEKYIRFKLLRAISVIIKIVFNARKK